MPCFKPLSAWYTHTRNPVTKKYGITFTKSEAHVDRPLTLPCGRCIGCRLEKSRQWALRCVHEASLHEKNCFITLTYNTENLPEHGSLVLRDFQLFMKRLREKYGPGIRFFHCGEYGENFGRPHYHALLFNFDFPDKKQWKNKLYVSEELNQLWGKGYCSIGEANFETAAYVARYITKKQTGPRAHLHYDLPHDPVTGEIHSRKPEYITMSRRPGIAKKWIEKWAQDVYNSDTVIHRGKPSHPPKFYDRHFELVNPDEMRFIKLQRTRDAKARAAAEGDPRLSIKEQCRLFNLKQLKRTYENEIVSVCDIRQQNQSVHQPNVLPVSRRSPESVGEFYARRIINVLKASR